MKKIFATAAFMAFALSVLASPGFSYHAAVQNPDGSMSAGKQISVRFSIVAESGETVYSETHATKTDQFGNIGLTIGQGNPETGSFKLIDWNDGGFSLLTEIDRGSGYTLSGSQKFGSVPYAMNAESAGGLTLESADGSMWDLKVDDNGNLSTSKMESEIIPIPNGYSRLVFNDEFNTDGMPDPAKWTFEEGYIRNGEMQCYIPDRYENCHIADGKLQLIARNDNYEYKGETHKVTSASIHTRNKEKWTYCRVDVRAKLASTLGSWPAIWMMPNDEVYGYWPNSGEIDIMEHVGYDPNKVYFTSHCAEQNGANNKYHSSAYLPTNATEYHVYSLVWTKDKLSWLVDDKVKFTVKKQSNSWRGWPYNQDFYLILNLAYGGGWGGQQGVDLSKLPITYYVDYVRVYQ